MVQPQLAKSSEKGVQVHEPWNEEHLLRKQEWEPQSHTQASAFFSAPINMFQIGVSLTDNGIQFFQGAA